MPSNPSIQRNSRGGGGSGGPSFSRNRQSGHPGRSNSYNKGQAGTSYNRGGSNANYNSSHYTSHQAASASPPPQVQGILTNPSFIHVTTRYLIGQQVVVETSDKRKARGVLKTIISPDDIHLCNVSWLDNPSNGLEDIRLRLSEVKVMQVLDVDSDEVLKQQQAGSGDQFQTDDAISSKYVAQRQHQPTRGKSYGGGGSGYRNNNNNQMSNTGATAGAQDAADPLAADLQEFEFDDAPLPEHLPGSGGGGAGGNSSSGGLDAAAAAAAAAAALRAMNSNEITIMEKKPEVGQKIQSDQKSMDESVTTKSELSLFRKFLFGLSAPPLQMSSNVVGFYFNIFMLESAKLPPYLVSVILFLGRAWDAVTDPAVGHFVSKTETRFGRVRPWLMLANPIGCATFFILWLVLFPVTEDYNGIKFAYYLTCYLLYCTLITCYHVPYTSSTMLIARLPRDKDQATAFRMSFELLGTIVGVGLFGIISNMSRIAVNCGKVPEITDAAIMQERYGYMMGAAVIVGLYFLCGLAGSFGIKEKYRDVTVSQDSFLTNVKSVLSFKPYVLLMLAFLFMSLGVQMVQTNLALYTTHSLDLGEHTSYGILCVLGIAILAIPFWMKMSDRFGKKNIFAFGIILFIPCLFTAMFIPPNIVWVYYLAMSLSGLAISIAMLLPWSMLPDVIDDYFLRYGKRREATFYSLYVFFNKFAVGFSMAASQITLSAVSYDSSPGACEQSHAVGLALRYLVGPGPIICLLISLVLIYVYPINKQYRDEMTLKLTQLVKRQDSVDDLVDGGSVSSVDGYSNQAFDADQQIARAAATRAEMAAANQDTVL